MMEQLRKTIPSTQLNLSASYLIFPSLIPSKNFYDFCTRWLIQGLIQFHLKGCVMANWETYHYLITNRFQVHYTFHVRRAVSITAAPANPHSTIGYRPDCTGSVRRPPITPTVQLNFPNCSTEEISNLC